jgi:hypothetical protein
MSHETSKNRWNTFQLLDNTISSDDGLLRLGLLNFSNYPLSNIQKYHKISETESVSFLTRKNYRTQ